MAELPGAAIAGLGACVPDKVLTNADFEKFLDTSDEWIVKRTGIKERHVVSDGESTATLAAEASRRALDDAGMTADELEMIICATVSPEMPFPATACFVQNALGITDIPSFDIGAACSGYIYALAVGAQFIHTGAYSNILVIGADTLSRFADYKDRGSCILFGDAAGATILQATSDPDKGIQHTVLHSDGSRWDMLHVPGGGSRYPATHKTVDDRLHYVHMKGREVFRFAVEKMQWLMGEGMDKCGLRSEDVDLVVPHQVNIRVIKAAVAKFDFPMEKVALNIDKYGNTSAASIPLAMDQAYRAGRIGPGSVVILVSFGAGLTWAGAVIRL